MKNNPPRTLFQKVWDSHIAAHLDGNAILLYIDLHLVNEVTSPQAFDGLRASRRCVRCPENTIAVADHNVPTENRMGGVDAIADPESRLQVQTLERNVSEFGVPYVPLVSCEQGIVHIIGPELGLTLPGSTIVCGDSHTSTHGAFGALAFGVGTSEVEHVLATQTLIQQPVKSMLVRIIGHLGNGVTAKDLILHIIGVVGTGGATGYVIEYAGEALKRMDMAGRMTICNMSIEAGARAGMIAPDDTTYEYIRDRPLAPNEDDFETAKQYWDTLTSDDNAEYDRVVEIDASLIEPKVTWGTSPEAVINVGDRIPDPAMQPDAAKRRQAEAALEYMGLSPNQPILGVPIDVVFIGSCTNARIEDLRSASLIVKGRQVATQVRALVVPGSSQVKAQAEAEGLDKVFLAAGFEWRDAGCSMCLGMNPDQLAPQQRCASTSNRNFEGRQGPGGRTHLMSPAMAAAAAIAGSIVDSRQFCT